MFNDLMCEVKKVLGMCEGGGHFKIIVLSRQESADRMNKRVDFIEFFATPQGLQ